MEKEKIISEIEKSMKEKGWSVERGKYGFDIYARKKGILLEKKALIRVFTREVNAMDVIEAYNDSKAYVGTEIWLVSNVGFTEEAENVARKFRVIGLIKLEQRYEGV